MKTSHPPNTATRRRNDLNPDEPEMIGSGTREAAELRPDMLTKEELDDIARFVRFAKRRRGSCA